MMSGQGGPPPSLVIAAPSHRFSIDTANASMCTIDVSPRSWGCGRRNCRCLLGTFTVRDASHSDAKTVPVIALFELFVEQRLSHREVFAVKGRCGMC